MIANNKLSNIRYFEKVLYVIIISIIHSFFLLGCSNYSRELKRTFKDYNGKQIILPDSIMLIVNSKEIPLTYSNPNSLRIVSYINGNCSDCLQRLYEWEKLYNDYQETLEDISLLLFITANNYIYIESIIEKNKFSFPVIYDTDNLYIKMNEFSVDFQFKTFLIDDSNKILCIGNPTSTPELRAVYLDRITNYSLKQ